MASPQSVYVLRTHKMDAPTRDLFCQMRRDLGAHRVFILYDETRGPWNPSDAPEGVAACRWSDAAADPAATAVLVSDAECLALNPMHDKGYGHTVAWTFWHPETSAVMMHDFLCARGVPFDYIWFIEYDVRCHGNMAAPLGICDAVAADFMAKGGDDRFELRRGGDGWCWWTSIEGDLAAFPMERRVGVFFPATRFSRAMVAAIRKHFGRSTGFCEVYIPTLCEAEGLVVAPMPREVFGVFVYQANTTPEAFARFAQDHPPNDLLYHPVK